MGRGQRVLSMFNVQRVGAGSARPGLYRVLVIPTKRSVEGSLPHILIPSLRTILFFRHKYISTKGTAPGGKNTPLAVMRRKPSQVNLAMHKY